MSSFVKHPECKERCQDTTTDVECRLRCSWRDADRDLHEVRHIFEERDTDQEARLDRKARARECK